MSFSMYDASIPVLRRMLVGLERILDKAKAYADERGLDPATLLQVRLYPDMFPLTNQVQIACDLAKGAAGRLGGAALPSFPDTEQTLDELSARVRRTLDFIAEVSPEAVAGSYGRPVTLKTPIVEVEVPGEGYLFDFAMPNFFFHVAAAYMILRHVGVPIGKSDYFLGGLRFEDALGKPVAAIFP